MPDESIMRDIHGCARCHTNTGHLCLTFDPLDHPFVDSDGTVFSHWAQCPANGQPILLAIVS